MKKLLLTTAVLLALPTIAAADETLKWRHVQHTASFQSTPVGDAEGHTLNVYRIPGLATLPDGGIVRTQVIGQGDAIKGTGPVRGYLLATFSDGSELHATYTGEVKLEGNHAPRSGTFTVLGGKGRYQNAKGDGTWTGDGNFVGDGDGLAYIDVVLNVKTGDQVAEAKAMLQKAAAAIKADREVALAQINKGEGGFRVGDLYPFCNRLSDGKIVAGPVSGQAGFDGRLLTDSTGFNFGKPMIEAMKKPEGVMTEISYTWPKPGTTSPSYPKVSYVMRAADDIGCGVGIYK